MSMTNRDSMPTEMGQDGRTEAGFTLVEALVAIVVLVFGLIGVTNLMIVAASSNAVANQGTAAATIAAQQLELLKATPYNTLAAGGSVEPPDVAGFFRDDDLPGVGRIHTRWEVVATGDPLVRFVRVRSEGTGVLSVRRSRAEFTTFRTCTSAVCP
jgi:type II secretory pathway pseudopilin PulG